MMQGKLYRSRTNRSLGGVCAGLSRYLNVDVSWVRIVFMLLAVTNGVGLWLYLALWLALPLEGAEEAGLEDNIRASAAEMRGRLGGLGRQAERTIGEANPQTALLVGAGLVLLGALMLLRRFGWFHWLNLGYLWPLLLVALGVWLLVRYIRER